MEQQIIIDILKWLLPTGGFGSVVLWLFNRTNRELKLIKESHDVYKVMYEDIKQTLEDEIEEKRQLRKALGRFERAISKVFKCKYYPNCPVDIELRTVNDPIHKTPRHGGMKSRQSGDRGDPDKDDDTEGSEDSDKCKS